MVPRAGRALISPTGMRFLASACSAQPLPRIVLGGPGKGPGHHQRGGNPDKHRLPVVVLGEGGPCHDSEQGLADGRCSTLRQGLFGGWRVGVAMQDSTDRTHRMGRSALDLSSSILVLIIIPPPHPESAPRSSRASLRVPRSGRSLIFPHRNAVPGECL